MYKSSLLLEKEKNYHDHSNPNCKQYRRPGFGRRLNLVLPHNQCSHAEPKKRYQKQRPGKKIADHDRDVKEESPARAPHLLGVSRQIVFEDEGFNVGPTVLIIDREVPRQDDRRDNRPTPQAASSREAC